MAKNISHNEDLPEVTEIMQVLKEQVAMSRNIQGGINKLLASQVDVLGLLDELKPLRSLPEISTSLSKLVERLIEPATNPKRSLDIVAIIAISTLAFLLTIFVLKENNFLGKLNLFGGNAEIQSSAPEKKTPQ